MSNEQDLLNLAQDFKSIVEKKDRYIEILMDKIEDVEDKCREVEYKLSQLEFLLDYKLETSSKEQKPFLKRVASAIKFMEGKIDKSRIILQEKVEEEDILLQLNFE
jgi:hypothetical protein